MFRILSQGLPVLFLIQACFHSLFIIFTIKAGNFIVSVKSRKIFTVHKKTVSFLHETLFNNEVNIVPITVTILHVFYEYMSVYFLKKIHHYIFYLLCVRDIITDREHQRSNVRSTSQPYILIN